MVLCCMLLHLKMLQGVPGSKARNNIAYSDMLHATAFEDATRGSWL